MFLQSHTTNKSHYISTTRVPMANKLRRMVAHLDGLLSTKSHDPLITWSCEIAWQKDRYISIIALAMATELGRMVTYLAWVLTIKWHNTLFKWSCKFTWQTKSLYFFYQGAYGHQTWENGDILWETPNHKVILHFDHVVLQGHVAN